MKTNFLIRHAGLLFIFLSACTQVDVNGLNPDDFKNGGDGSGTANSIVNCDGVSADFSKDVLPFFDATCSSTNCHYKGAAGGGLNLDKSDLAFEDGVSGVIGNIKTKNEINLTVPAQSNLILHTLATSEGGTGSSHTGGEIFKTTSDADYKKVYCWIAAGAKNDLTPSKCTFGENVFPIFASRGCNGCHNTTTHAGGWAILTNTQMITNVPNSPYSFPSASATDSYTSGPDIAAAHDDTSLILQKPIGGLDHNNNGLNLLGSVNDPDYKTIKCWIDEGALNN